jgi:hypothetical protein
LVELYSIVAYATTFEPYGTFTYGTNYMDNLSLGTNSTQCPPTFSTTSRPSRSNIHYPYIYTYVDARTC